MSADRPLLQDNLIILACYTTAAAVGIATALALPDQHPLLAAALADVLATISVFVYSRATGNSSCYDAYWSVAPLLIALWWASIGDGDPLRVGLCLTLLFLWGTRLTYNWWSGWTGMKHIDWRYVQLRRQSGPFWMFIDFFGIHLFPTILVYLGLLGVFVATNAGRPLGVLDAFAVFLGVTSLAFETLADHQLRAFKRTDPSPHDVLDTGLWAWSRHPNYFGELCIWWSMACFGAAADPSQGWVWLGPLAMSVLFVFISIPLIERRMLKKRPHYREVQHRVSMFVPLPPKPRIDPTRSPT